MQGNAYTTVGTVCAATLLGRLVDLDVLDDQVAGVKTLGVGVGLGVLEQAEQELSALHRPTGLGDTELLALTDNQYLFCPKYQLIPSPISQSRETEYGIWYGVYFACILARG